MNSSSIPAELWDTNECIKYYSQTYGKTLSKINFYSIIRRRGVKPVASFGNFNLYDPENIRHCVWKQKIVEDLHQNIYSIPNGYMSLGDIAKTYNLKISWLKMETNKINLKAFKAGGLLYADPKEALELANWIPCTTLRRKGVSPTEILYLIQSSKKREYPPLLTVCSRCKRVYAPQYSMAFEKDNEYLSDHMLWNIEQCQKFFQKKYNRSISRDVALRILSVNNVETFRFLVGKNLYRAEDVMRCQYKPNNKQKRHEQAASVPTFPYIRPKDFPGKYGIKEKWVKDKIFCNHLKVIKFGHESYVNAYIVTRLSNWVSIGCLTNQKVPKQTIQKLKEKSQGRKLPSSLRHKHRTYVYAPKYSLAFIKNHEHTN